MTKTTSTPEINGDQWQPWQEKLRYLATNFRRAFRGTIVFSRTRLWRMHITREGSDTPARKYIDDFLHVMLPQLLANKEGRILDVGCGTGYLRDELEQLEFRGEYVGIDTGLDWEGDRSYSFPSLFVRGALDEYIGTTPFDLVVSVTVLEHTQDDEDFLRRTRALVAPGGVELHMVPSSWSLPLYLLHGYRQYSPCRIRQLFPGAIIYRLGGFFSFLLQLLVATIPERLTGRRLIRNRSWYSWLTWGASRLDFLLPFGASTYAIIFHKE